MPSFRNALCNAGDCCFRVRQTQEKQFDPIALFLPAWNPSSIAASTQSRLEGKAVAFAHMVVNLLQHHPSSLYSNRVRAKRVQARCDKIGVDEDGAISLVGQKLCCESSLTRAVRTSNYESFFFE